MSTRSLLAFLLVGTGWIAAAPVSLPNAGLTIELPSGWTIDSVADAQGKPSFLWHPVDSLPRVLMGVELYDSIPVDSNAQWTYYMSYAHKLSVESDPCRSGEVLSWSYYKQDSFPGAFVNSFLTLDAYCQDPVLAWQDRFFANGTHGWQLYLVGDTSEVLDHYDHWTSLLDSVKILRDWKGWTPLSIASRSASTGSLHWSFSGRQLSLQGLPQTFGWLLDSRGRPVRRVQLDAQGKASVPTDRLPSGVYHVRLGGSGAIRSQSATLSLIR